MKCVDCAYYWAEEIGCTPFCHRTDDRCVEDDYDDERYYEEVEQFWADLASEMEA